MEEEIEKIFVDILSKLRKKIIEQPVCYSGERKEWCVTIIDSNKNDKDLIVKYIEDKNIVIVLEIKKKENSALAIMVKYK